MMWRRIFWIVAIACLLILVIPLLAGWVKVTYLTFQYGAELAEAAVQFEIVTDTSSGSPEKYYSEERPRFSLVSTGSALAIRRDFWDSVWSGAPENRSNLYLVTEQHLSNVRIIEYDGIRANMLARIQWHYRRINRNTMLVEEEHDAAAERTYWFVFEDGIWKVSDFESTGPGKQ